MTTAPLRCTVAPHPPCSLLPHGEKGEFGRPGARNGRWHAEACQQTYPCEAARGRDARAPTRRQRRPTFILVVRDCGRAVMTTAPLRCTFAPHPPCPLLPHGVKGEFGCAEARNERRNAGASRKTCPCEAACGRDARAPRACDDARAPKRRQHRPTFISVARDCGRAVMTTAPLRCTVAPHPPCSLLPHGVERGGI